MQLERPRHLRISCTDPVLISLFPLRFRFGKIFLFPHLIENKYLLLFIQDSTSSPLKIPWARISIQTIERVRQGRLRPRDRCYRNRIYRKLTSHFIFKFFFPNRFWRQHRSYLEKRQSGEFWLINAYVKNIF